MLVRKMMAVAVTIMLATSILAVTGCDNAADGENKWTAADIGINMVSVTGGKVPLTNDYQPTVSSFYMSETEVTQKQWKEVVGNNGYGPTPSAMPVYGQGDNFPMYYVNWYDTIVFCNKLSMKEGRTPCYKKGSETDPAKWGNPPSSDDATWKAITCDWTADGYRLPTEAEWEYAARGGSTNPYKTYSGTEGNDENALKEVAWYDGNSGDGGGTSDGKSHEVKTKPKNRNPIKDMSGNVWEWCWDRYNKNYDTSKNTDPTGSSSSTDPYRIVRGGSWNEGYAKCTVSKRSSWSPFLRYNDFGFRVVCRN